MPTRKQRRRRAKEHRHEYVWEDAEGNELERSEVPSKAQSSKRAGQSRPAREVQPPSWRRTLKRGLVFAPIMFAAVFLLSPGLPLATKIVQTAFFVAVFVPFSYFLDGVFYRSHKRRLARHEQPGGRRGS